MGSDLSRSPVQTPGGARPIRRPSGGHSAQDGPAVLARGSRNLILTIMFAPFLTNAAAATLATHIQPSLSIPIAAPQHREAFTRYRKALDQNPYSP